MCSLVALPKEICCEIFCKIPPQELINVSSLCRTFNVYISEDYFWKLNFEKTYTPVDFRFRINLCGIDTWKGKYKKCWKILPTLPKLGKQCTYRFSREYRGARYCLCGCVPGKNYCHIHQKEIEIEAKRSDILRVCPYKCAAGYLFNAETGLILKADNNIIYVIAQDVDGHIQLPSTSMKGDIESKKLKIPDTPEEELYTLLNKIAQVH